LALKPVVGILDNGSFGLSGPVARVRKVLYRPPLPKISLTRDVSVKLKFWVRPDGSISRVETVKIGDLELVNVAEKYLQQWRFSILPTELPQQEQWGTVTVVFRVSR
jgi:outer membrane biosynthesis protein TonB